MSINLQRNLYIVRPDPRNDNRLSYFRNQRGENLREKQGHCGPKKSPSQRATT